MKLRFKILLSAVILVFAFALAGCGVDYSAQSGRLSVTATVFSAYDFARAVAGDCADVTMLLSPGTEIHSYDPVPADIVNIEKSDIFMYVGGESDTWVDGVIDSVEKKPLTLCMTDCCELVCEDGEEEYDEHVWTSPENALKILDGICEIMSKADPENAEIYCENKAAYAARIQKADAETRGVINSAVHRSIVVADRFPLKYFCLHYGLSYEAAFDACDVSADADAATVIRLIDAVKKEKLSHVFYIEMSSGYVADTVCRETGSDMIMINTLHNISKDDFESGITYVDVMEANKEALKRGLN